MSRRYAPDHKKLVLQILRDYQDNVFATSFYTGVPVRTINQWQREQRELAARSRAAAQPAPTAMKRQPPP